MSSVTEKDASPNGSGTVQIDRNFAYRLALVTHLYERTAAEIYERKGGLTAAQWKVLALLAKLGPVQAVDVARSSTLDKGAVSRAVKYLRQRGLADRELDPNDARRVDLFLTDRGFDLYREIQQETRALHQDLFAGADGGDMDRFFAILKHLETRLLA